MSASPLPLKKRDRERSKQSLKSKRSPKSPRTTITKEVSICEDDIDTHESLQIHIITTRNLKGSKGDHFFSMVRVELGNRFLGESIKTVCSKNSPALYNFTTNLNLKYDDLLGLDEIIPSVRPAVHDIIATPLVISVLEVLPKDYKQKEDKINILGQCCVDLIPFVKGATELTQTLTINPVPGSPLEYCPPGTPKPEIDINLTLSDPLLPETEMNESNMMTITVGSLYSPPETWNVNTGGNYVYCTSMPVPMYTDREIPVVMSNGHIRSFKEKEVPDKQTKWASPGTAIGISEYIPGKYIFSDPIEDEDGDLKTFGDREHRRYAEQEKNRVTWNSERRCYIESSAINSFKESIAKNRYWPIEIFRLTNPHSNIKNKREKETERETGKETGISFHGIAFINMTSLLYKGNKRIKGAFKVIPYTEEVLSQATRRKSGVSEESARYVYNDQNPTSVIMERRSRSSSKKFSFDRRMSKLTATEVEETVPYNADCQQYLDAKSYIMVEICMEKPLVPKPSCEVLTKRLSELIPSRQENPERTGGAHVAIDDYHGTVANATHLILDEFRELFRKEILEDRSETNEDKEARRQTLIGELNSSGKYFDIENKLRTSIIKIVREKYLRTSGFKNKQEIQHFVSELYGYLIDQMHVSLGKVLNHEDQGPVPEILKDDAQLKYIAREAEVSRNFDLAATYYKMRIDRNRSDPNLWFDYGTFNLNTNDITKAAECFKECIALDHKYLHGLLLFGVVSTLTETTEDAEMCFEAAICLQPNSLLAWTMLGLYYETVHDPVSKIAAEMAYCQANKLNENLHKSEEKGEEGRRFGEKEGEIDGDVNFVDLERKPTLEQSDMAADTKQLKKLSYSRRKSAYQIKSKNSMKKKSKNQFTSTDVEIISNEPSQATFPSIFLQAFDWLIEVKAISFAEKALANEFLALNENPTLEYHIALTRLKLHKEEYQSAVEILNEALKYEFENPDAWSLMGHIKYMMGQFSEARDCYERSLSFVTDARDMYSIYLRLAPIYLQEERYQDAKTTFFMACKKSPSHVSWLGLGISCYRLGQLCEAEDALCEANLLNNNDPEVWAYLSLVCLKTNRKFEAEQAYKYAVKMKLDNGPLLAEINKEQLASGFGNPAF